MTFSGIPQPPEFQPGDRVQIAEGMFVGVVGEVIGPDPDHAGHMIAHLKIWGRDVEIGLPVWMFKPALPDPP
jgi:transcription antitermination factor NusG